MDRAKERILDDLIDHFSYRLRQLLSDSANRCDEAEIDGRSTAIALTSAMLFEVEKVAICFGYSKAEYLKLCEHSWNGSVAHHRQQLKKDSRS